MPPIDPLATGMYVLNREQEDEYVDYVDLFLPINGGIDMATGEGYERSYPNPSTPTYINVPMRRKPTPDFEDPRLGGQTTEVNIMTEDHFHMHVLQPISTDTMMRWAGNWWTVQGEPRPLWANGRMDTDSQQVYAKFGAGFAVEPGIFPNG